MKDDWHTLKVGCLTVALMYMFYGVAIMWAWNILFVQLFEFPAISFWQGAAIFLIYNLIAGMFKKNKD